MKKVILNIFVLIPLALFMMIYVDGESEKKIVHKMKSNHSNGSIIISSEKQAPQIKTNSEDFIAQKKNKEATITPSF
ncbi:hypothetical protein N9335_04220 [Crocinitomicaceae bacterium]|nr:hypothetical protein [Crocinitomicaceae bacterium]